MTVQEAWAVLERPLVFGNAWQIEALRFLRGLEVARHLVTYCKRCRGAGVTARGFACRWCAAQLAPEILTALGIATKPRPGQAPPTQTTKKGLTLF